MSLSATKPADFESFWRGTMDDLARFPARPEIEVLPIRCTDYATMYRVLLTGAGPYRLFAYLSVPVGEGPFPAIYYVPGYSSVVAPIPQGSPSQLRSRYVTLSLAARGQRNSDMPFAATFPGFLTEGIDDHDSYMYRWVAADCVRGLEFLLSRPSDEVDATMVTASGGDMALIASALHPGATHLICGPALFYDTAELASRTQEYPLTEINDYLRLHPDRTDEVRRTLSYFDLRWFAPRVRATALLLAGAPGSPLDRRALEPLVGSVQGDVTVHDSERSSYKDGLFTESWLTEQLGFDEPILPEGWQ
jgi:cephalosporin-C deacetylase-like acetyl esterase